MARVSITAALGTRAKPTRRLAGWLGLGLCVYGVWQVSGWSWHREVVGDVANYPIDAAAAVAAFLAARRCAAVPKLQAGWILIGLALTMYLVGDVVWTGYEAAGAPPYPSAADGFYLAFYPLMLSGLFLFGVGRLGRDARLRLGLDLGVVALGGAAIVTYVVLGPTLLQDDSASLQTIFSVAYPVGDLILLVGLGSVLLRRSAPSSDRALQFLAATLVLWVIADMLYGYLSLHSAYHGGDVVDSLYMISMVMFALAASAQRVPDPDAVVADDRPRPSWAPYVAVAVCFGLLLRVHGGDPMFPNTSLVIASILAVVLVSVRQYLAQRDLVQTRGEMSYRSLHDELTGLPNRTLLTDRAGQMLARARRAKYEVGVLYIDIDDFKRVTDSLGRREGDVVLRAVAARLAGTVRGSDTVGRLESDEFVVLVDDSAFEVGPELVAERICDVLRQPIDLGSVYSNPVLVTASVGIAVGVRETAEDLIGDAGIALGRAKAAGKDRWVVFESHMHAVLHDRFALELDLKTALANDELFLLYQPTFDLSTETIDGVEALLRWRHPVRGVVSPDVFIPLMEDNGLILPVGRWVLRTACAQAARWHAAGHDLRIAVNVSGRQLEREEFVVDVADVLELTGLDPSALTLEITETALMRDAPSAARRLRVLKDLGIRIAIDDFGTGYSSLAYLRQFPVDRLKIDRSFVSDIVKSGDSRALIHTLVQLGKTLGLETLGEGIETRAQLRELQRQGCDLGQGFLFSRPVPPAQLDELLQRHVHAAL